MTYELKRVSYNWRVIIAIAGAAAVFGVVWLFYYASRFFFGGSVGIGSFFQSYSFLPLLIIGGFLVAVFLIEVGILYGMIFFYNIVARYLGGLRFDIKIRSQEE